VDRCYWLSSGWDGTKNSVFVKIFLGGQVLLVIFRMGWDEKFSFVKIFFVILAMRIQ
jgi:hypothetical protein